MKLHTECLDTLDAAKIGDVFEARVGMTWCNVRDGASGIWALRIEMFARLERYKKKPAPGPPACRQATW